MSVINTNIKALAAQDSSRIAENKLTTAMERLSTGLRINSAKDDAAGLAIASRMTSQVRGIGMAIRNANDGISLTQTAEGAMGQVTGMLQRMRELAVQASTGTMTSNDRDALQMEVSQLKSEIDSIAEKTSFNTIKLLDGSAKNINIQTGANAAESMTLGFDSVKTKDIGVGEQSGYTSLGGGVGKTTVTGSAITAGNTAGGSFTINDVTVSVSATTATAAAVGAATVAAVNALTYQTGVVAVYSSGAVNLMSLSGGSIAVDGGAGPTAGQLGLNGTATTAATSSQKLAAFTAGALLLNGVAVGASLSTDDQASFGPMSMVATSAIAKAAAINRVAAQSGVYAKVAANEVAGAQMTGSAATGTMTINGVATASISTTTDTSVSRSRVVDAINAISNQTGVVAVDTHDDNQGVKLVAKDGRNVVVWYDTNLTKANTGVADTGSYVGKFDLFTQDGSDFTVDQSFGSNINNLGIRTGTYKSGVAEAVTLARSGVSSSDTVAALAGVLNGNTLIINDVQIAAGVAGDDTSSYVAVQSTKAASAIAIAAAINKKSDITGVTATAKANVLRGSDFTAGTVGTLYLNGETIAVSTGSRANVLSAINAKSSVTGVVASEWGNGVQLVAADGRNIVISSSTIDNTNLGLTGVSIGTSSTTQTTYYSTVDLKSDKAFTVSSGSEGNANFELLGFRAGTFGGDSAGTKIAEIDIATLSGASQAIGVIDAALNKVLLNQSKAGAFNNRLDEVVNNLTEANQNLTASRSRIQDTDYATETTNLAKNQIIQQAATAMLAQANQSAQTVLALLK